MDNEEKLRNFENACRVEARNKKNELEAQINSKIQVAIQEQIEEYNFNTKGTVERLTEETM